MKKIITTIIIAVALITTISIIYLGTYEKDVEFVEKNKTIRIKPEK